jgi:hypothetical protein
MPGTPTADFSLIFPEKRAMAGGLVACQAFSNLSE